MFGRLCIYYTFKNRTKSSPLLLPPSRLPRRRDKRSWTRLCPLHPGIAVLGSTRISRPALSTHTRGPAEQYPRESKQARFGSAPNVHSRGDIKYGVCAMKWQGLKVRENVGSTRKAGLTDTLFFSIHALKLSVF